MKINGSIWAGRALLAAFLLSFLMGSAQQPVSLDSCRQMALKNNKQLRIAEAIQKTRLGELISRE